MLTAYYHAEQLPNVRPNLELTTWGRIRCSRMKIHKGSTPFVLSQALLPKPFLMQKCACAQEIFLGRGGRCLL